MCCHEKILPKFLRGKPNNGGDLEVVIIPVVVVVVELVFSVFFGQSGIVLVVEELNLFTISIMRSPTVGALPCNRQN